MTQALPPNQVNIPPIIRRQKGFSKTNTERVSNQRLLGTVTLTSVVNVQSVIYHYGGKPFFYLIKHFWIQWRTVAELKQVLLSE
jgi:hypothetical protein